MSDLDWLNARAFTHIGYWSPPDLKLKRLSKLHREQGVYAFVVGDRVRYLGKATSIRSRLRGYNRATDPNHPRPPRTVHTAIHQSWGAGARIDVWFRRVADDQVPGTLESQWIAELQPQWNVAGIVLTDTGLPLQCET